MHWDRLGEFMDEAALKDDILSYLSLIGVAHETVEHPAAPTVEEHTQYVGGMGGQAKQVSAPNSAPLAPTRDAAGTWPTHASTRFTVIS